MSEKAQTAKESLTYIQKVIDLNAKRVNDR